MWHVADIAENIRHAEGYQSKGPGAGGPQVSWAKFMPQHDVYIRHLNGIYDRNINKEGAKKYHGTTRLLSPSEVEMTTPPRETYTLKMDRVCVATGRRRTMPSEDKIPKAGLGIDSDGFFRLAECRGTSRSSAQDILRWSSRRCCTPSGRRWRCLSGARRCCERSARCSSRALTA